MVAMKPWPLSAVLGSSRFTTLVLTRHHLRNDSYIGPDALILGHAQILMRGRVCPTLVSVLKYAVLCLVLMLNEAKPKNDELPTSYVLPHTPLLFVSLFQYWLPVLRMSGLSFFLVTAISSFLISAFVIGIS